MVIERLDLTFALLNPSEAAELCIVDHGGRQRARPTQMQWCKVAVEVASVATVGGRSIPAAFVQHSRRQCTVFLPAIPILTATITCR